MFLYNNLTDQLNSKIKKIGIVLFIYFLYISFLNILSFATGNNFKPKISACNKEINNR